MKKLKLTEEQVREEAAKHNMTLDPRHFVEVEKKSGRPAKELKEPKELKAKGRPKKSKKVLELAGEEEDLFASLVMSANKIEDVIAETVTSEVSSEADDNSSLGDVDVVVDAKSKPKTDKKPKVSAEEKAALAEQKKLALAEQKKQEAEQKKLEAEQKKIALAEQKKLEAEVKKFALAEQKKAEAEQKKLEAEQKKQALAEQKKQEAEQKKLALAEQKKLALAEQKKPAEKKVATKKTKVDDDDRPSPAFVDPPAEEADVVKKIMFEGKKYLKSKNTGIIYNMEQDVIGKWNEAKNRIDFDVADEESEEEYDEDM
jgi:phage-related minor tail protein